MSDAATKEQPRPRGSGIDVMDSLRQSRIQAWCDHPGRTENLQIEARILDDMEARIQKGAAQYGERLTSHNGRCVLTDIYQELLDAMIYLHQAELEGKISSSASAQMGHQLRTFAASLWAKLALEEEQKEAAASLLQQLDHPSSIDGAPAQDPDDEPLASW